MIQNSKTVGIFQFLGPILFKNYGELVSREHGVTAKLLGRTIALPLAFTFISGDAQASVEKKSHLRSGGNICEVLHQPGEKKTSPTWEVNMKIKLFIIYFKYIKQFVCNLFGFHFKTICFSKHFSCHIQTSGACSKGTPLVSGNHQPSTNALRQKTPKSRKVPKPMLDLSAAA